MNKIQDKKQPNEIGSLRGKTNQHCKTVREWTHFNSKINKYFTFKSLNMCPTINRQPQIFSDNKVGQSVIE
jgi:hypothetical protein